MVMHCLKIFSYVQFDSQHVQFLMNFFSDVSFTRKTLEKKSLEKNGFEIRSI